MPVPAAFADPAIASQSGAILPASQTAPGLTLPMQWSQAVRPCALAGLVAAMAMVFKLVVPLIAVIGAGFLAVVFYRRNSPGAVVRAGAGARIGALCGVLCSAMTAVLAALRVAVLHEGEAIRQMMLELIQQNAARYSDPQSLSTLEFLRSPPGLVFMMVFLLIFGFIMILLLGTIGGALGASILGRRNRP